MSHPNLRVRVYNVLFGDAILVLVPDEDESGQAVQRSILIDVGNAYNGDGGDDAVFKAVVEDILAATGERPIDLFVMTHEHLDHVQGLPYAFHEWGLDPAVDTAWLTVSSEKTYYERYPDARKKKLTAEVFDALTRALTAGDTSGAWQHLLAINDPRRTAQCVDHLRDLAGEARTHYVFRGMPTEGKHPFRRATIDLWAPEEDCSDYYGRYRPLCVDAGSVVNDEGNMVVPIPPPGVDAATFYKLVEARREGIAETMLAIDKAANNTSVVFCLNWRGRKLLFAGDAETRSWREMNDRGVLEPVDLLKISHHGSHNGTPDEEMLEILLPGTEPAGRHGLLSTRHDVHNGVPHYETLGRLGRRCVVKSTESIAPGEYHEIEITPDD